jgi:hypothetical protein
LSVRQVDDLHAAVREAVRHAPRDATVAVIAADDAAEELVPLIDVPDVTTTITWSNSSPSDQAGRHHGVSGDRGRRTPLRD